MYLFVYGSLKNGFYNHERFGFHKHPFIGEYKVKGYRLWNLGDYPGMTRDAGSVQGEVYDVPINNKWWNVVKDMEEGAGFYLVPIDLMVEGNQVHSFIYEGGLGGATIIPSGEWVDGKS